MEKFKKLLGSAGNFSQMFGKVSGKFALSFDGKVAIFSENSETYQCYDKESCELKDVGELILDVPFFFKMPVKSVSVGDLILINDIPHYVIKNNGAAGISVLNVETGNIVEKVKRTNILNINFYIKVVSLINEKTFGETDSDNPMQNMLPFLLMGEKSGEKSSMMEMMLMMQMMGGKQSDNPMQNMLPFLLLGEGEKSSGMEMMLMMQMMNGKQSDNPMQNMLPFLLMGEKSGETSSKNDLLMMMMLPQLMGGENVFASKKSEKEDKKSEK